MNFKCIFGYEENENFICSYDKQLCECPIGIRCRILERSKDEYKEQIKWDYMAHTDIRS